MLKKRERRRLLMKEHGLARSISKTITVQQLHKSRDDYRRSSDKKIQFLKVKSTKTAREAVETRTIEETPKLGVDRVHDRSC
jgi:hypothetical protein